MFIQQSHEREQLADFHVKNICMKLEEALSVENPDTKQLLDFSIRRYSGGIAMTTNTWTFL